MTLQLVASCTERKRAPVPEGLMLRQLEGEAERSAAWLRRLAEHECSTKSARDLYGGEHWQVVLELESTLREHGRDVQLWVASAGYGLVSADAQLKPYSATFAPHQPDSIPPDAASDWWAALCAEPLHGTSLRQLAVEADNLVVIASAKYLRAMLPDLNRARKALGDPERLIVFSGSDMPELAESLVRVDARVQVALSGETERDLRGTKQGLAARTARHLLTSASPWPPTASAQQKSYAQLVSDVLPPKGPDRERHVDDDVRAFILAQLEESPRAGWTSLLRMWRGSGRACEQKRFRGIYQDVKAQEK